MNQRITSVLLLALAGAALLAACATPPPATETGPVATETEAPTSTPAPTATATKPPEATPTLPPEDQIEALGTATDADAALYDNLLATRLTFNDKVELAIALRGLDPATIPSPPEAPLKDYKLGDVDKFWITNADGGGYTQIDAELMYISQHAYFFLDTQSVAVNGSAQRATSSDWSAAGQQFDDAYDKVRGVFGEENSPGIDGDPRLFILHSSRVGSIGGYFSGPDTLPAVVQENSNEKEMFIIKVGQGNADVRIAGAGYAEVLSHEFQHMIEERVNTMNDTWLNEGLSMLAELVAGYRADGFVPGYSAEPDQSLIDWGGDQSDYGQASLYTIYLYERYGPEFITSMLHSPESGLNAVDYALQEIESTDTADSVYSDMMVAAYLRSGTVEGGKYGFENAGVDPISADETLTSDGSSYVGLVNQYAMNVVGVRTEGQSTITFTGAQTAMLLPADAHSGSNMWWSNRDDSTYQTLTREVDLSGVGSATLSYWTWYNIEANYDYAYVMVSTDGGETWTAQTSTSSTDNDPNKANYGHGITGRSGGLRQPVWVQETVDLSAYAGQEILLGFFMINDEGVNLEGFAIDDISIPEIDFNDDAESDSGWTAQGFVRIHNRVPQRWTVRAVITDKNGNVRVETVEIVDGVGTVTADFATIDKVTLVISGLTRFTSLEAPYRVDVAPAQ